MFLSISQVVATIMVIHINQCHTYTICCCSASGQSTVTIVPVPVPLLLVCLLPLLLARPLRTWRGHQREQPVAKQQDKTLLSAQIAALIAWSWQ